MRIRLIMIILTLNHSQTFKGIWEFPMQNLLQKQVLESVLHGPELPLQTNLTGLWRVCDTAASCISGINCHISYRYSPRACANNSSLKCFSLFCSP